LSGAQPLRLFLDSNVLIRAVRIPACADRRVLELCKVGICRLVLSSYVRDEVETNLLKIAEGLGKEVADALILAYDRLIELTRPEAAPAPSVDEVLANRGLIRHFNDVPVLLSAITSKPDWLITNNIEHFTQTVALRTGLRIGTPQDFFDSFLDKSIP
jgi:predicted nucleic acid-binding protein